MRESIKKILKPIYRHLVKNPLVSIQMGKNYFADYRLYKRYSIVFGQKDIQNKEADLILNYHRIEKGMLFNNMKKGFARYTVTELHRILKDQHVLNNLNRSQVIVGYQVMCKYYENHVAKGYDISDFYSKDQYQEYKRILDTKYDEKFTGIYAWNKNDFYKNIEDNFELFAHSRKSVRNFTGELVPLEKIQKVIDLANTSPSVCNRQASNVYLLEDKGKIDEVLSIQGGFTGYSESVQQLLILTNDRRYYYTIGERSQLYIDGGIFLMNLLYSLHYHRIANCPANWGKNIDEEARLTNVICIPESEKIICLIPIGIATEQFNTTLSLRKRYTENLIILK
jgi:nitroreductase